MKWMRERDLLIAQTMAFVQSVTGKKLEAEGTVAHPVIPPSSVTPPPAEEAVTVATATAAVIPDIEALLAEGSVVESSRQAPRPSQIAQIDLRNDIKSEIKARVANFRAHQEKFHRERDAYCSATMAKVHAALRDSAGPARLEE
jgi:hypothetical protein